MSNITCPYCKGKGIRRKATYVYKNFGENFVDIYVCENYPTCDSYGGRTLANKELRELRRLTHYVFDKLWKNKHMTRAKAYSLMARVLEKKRIDAHIALLNKRECRTVIEMTNRILEFNKK